MPFRESEEMGGASPMGFRACKTGFRAFSTFIFPRGVEKVYIFSQVHQPASVVVKTMIYLSGNKMPVAKAPSFSRPTVNP